MEFDWSINGYPPLFVRVFIWLLITHWELLISLHLMHAWVFVFIRDIDMLIMMIVYLSWAFRLLRFFPCFIAIFVWDIWHADYDDWFILIEDSEIAIFFVLHCHIRLRYWHADCIDCLSISLSIVILIFAMIVLIALHVRIPCYTSFDLTCRLSGLYILLIVWAWCLYHYSSWLSQLVCIHEWYILYSAWLYGAWLPSICVIACYLSMWDAHLSLYLQLSWFRSFLSSRFSLLQVWGLLCACFLTEPEIRSRV